MSLKITSWKKNISRAIWIIIGLVLAIFVLRVAIWEYDYYNGKEGSERAVSLSASANVEQVDEKEPSKEEVKEYTVAADLPRYLSMESLGLSNQRVRALGLKKSGELETPNNIFDVGWYYSSGKPGKGATMLLDGHNGGPSVAGVFKKLPLACAREDYSTRIEQETGASRNCKGGKGDIIIIERGDGKKFKYEVYENITIPLSESDHYMELSMRPPIIGKESLTIITCTGEWSDKQKTYLSRQFLRAILVE